MIQLGVKHYTTERDREQKQMYAFLSFSLELRDESVGNTSPTATLYEQIQCRYKQRNTV
jgi:hypothetical protein